MQIQSYSTFPGTSSCSTFRTCTLIVLTRLTTTICKGDHYHDQIRSQLALNRPSLDAIAYFAFLQN